MCAPRNREFLRRQNSSTASANREQLQEIHIMIRRMLWIAFTIVLCAPCSAASQKDSAYEDVFTGFEFPRTLGSFVFQNRVEYAHVDLGYGLNYVQRGGATATIVVYHLNQHGIADGTDDARVVDEFTKMEEAIAVFARQGRYTSVQRVEAPRLSKAWLQMTHELVREDGRRVHAYSFIRGQRDRFVKIRITTAASGTAAQLPMLLLDVSRAIGMLQAT